MSGEEEKMRAHQEHAAMFKAARRAEKQRAPVFGTFERRVARRAYLYLKRTMTRTPKKWEIVLDDPRHDPPGRWRDGRYFSRAGYTDRRAFKNLLALGYIEHSRNGHCWLTEAGRKALGVKPL